METDDRVADCLKCGIGVKLQLEPDDDLQQTEVTEADIQQGDFFVCPNCQVAWEPNSGAVYAFPLMSSGLGGFEFNHRSFVLVRIEVSEIECPNTTNASAGFPHQGKQSVSE